MRLRIILLVIVLAMLFFVFAPVSFAEMDYENTYETALRLAKNDLTNLDNMNDAVIMLGQIGSFGFSRSYLLYFQHLITIQSENPDLITAKLMLEMCQDNADFTENLEQRAFPSCLNLLAYITAREQEEQGNLDAACAAYRKMSILDAPDRAANLALLIANATPTPISTTTMPSSNDYVAPKIIYPNPMLPGTTLKVVNCNNYITLRSEPDGDYGPKITTLRLNKEVELLRADKNGFYYVSSGNYEGYALAAYLVPADSIVFQGENSNRYESKFEQRDLYFNEIMIGETASKIISEKYGDNYKQILARDGYIWEYRERSFIFDSNGRLVKVIIFGSSSIGPRDITIGMYMAEALSTFPFDNPSISKDGSTHDLILFSDEKCYKVGAYAVINNSGSAGNGTIEVRDSAKYACMDISVTNSIVTEISVYINE